MIRIGCLGRLLACLLAAAILLPGGAAADCGCNQTVPIEPDTAAPIAYENHTIFFRNNCSQSVWIAANMGPNGPPFTLNNVTQGRGCTGCSCSGPSRDGWKENMTCCPSINCTHQSCPNTSCHLGVDLPNGGGFEVPPGLPVNYTVQADPRYGGNAALFPRYGCTLSADGTYLECDTGTCYVQGAPGTPPAGIVKCGGVPPNGPPDGTPQLPTTKMEIFFAPMNWSQTDSDFYDVSLADGYNIPVEIQPVPGTYYTGGTARNWCIRAGGTTDLLDAIQGEASRNLSARMLIRREGRPVAIWSSCSFETQVNRTGPGQPNATTIPGQGEQIWNLSCCKGSCSTEATCPIGNLPPDHQTSQFFGAFYNHTYTYQYGDDQANIPCKGDRSTGQLTSYLITFCGGRVLAGVHTAHVPVAAGVPVSVDEVFGTINLSLTASKTRGDQRVTFLLFDPSRPPHTFLHPITPVGDYYEISTNVPDPEITLMNLTVRYPPADPLPNGTLLRLFTYNGSSWVPLAPGGGDPGNRIVWGHTNHSGLFAISTYRPPEILNLTPLIPDPAAPLTVRFTAGVAGTGSLAYWWDVDGDGAGDYIDETPIHTYAAPGTYQVLLRVTDGSGLSSEREASVRISSYAIPLASGWNFISVPGRLDPAHANASKAFAPVEPTTRLVLSYDASSSEWVALRSDTVIVPLQGYWLNSAAPTTLPLVMDPDPPGTPDGIPLYPGWNAVGQGGFDPLPARLALGSAGENWTILISFNATDQRYDPSIIQGATGIHGEDRVMEPGRGYWLFMKGEGSLSAQGD